MDHSITIFGQSTIDIYCKSFNFHVIAGQGYTDYCVEICVSLTFLNLECECLIEILKLVLPIVVASHVIRL